MNLHELLSKINEHITKSDQIHRYIIALKANETHKHIVERFSFDFSVRSLRDKLNEKYLLEHYLLQLHDAKPADDVEKETILSAQSKVIKHLTFLNQGESIEDIESIKKEHISECSHYLYEAAKENNDDLFQAAIVDGADVNVGYYNQYPIFQAVKHKNHMMIDQLIKSRADVNKDSWGPDNEALLIAAVKTDNILLVKKLIDAGADINQEDLDEGNALNVACCERGVSLAMFNYLLSIKGIDVNMQFQPDGYSLHHSVLSAALDIMKKTHDRTKVIALLGSYRVHVTHHDFEMAYSVGIEAISLLIEFGYQATTDDLWIIINKINTDNINGDVIKLLMSTCPSTATIDRVKNNLQKYDHHTELMFYVTIGDTKKVLELLSSGCDNIDTCNKYGKTALMIAAQLGYADIVNLLLFAGANVDASNKYETPLTLATKGGYTEAVQILIDKQADVNKHATSYLDKVGETALTRATRVGHSDIVKILLNHTNIDISQSNVMGLKSKNKDITEAYKAKNTSCLSTRLFDKVIRKEEMKNSKQAPVCASIRR